jgi:arylformamidase
VASNRGESAGPALVDQGSLTKVGKSRFILLSYVLSTTAPAPGGRVPLRLQVDESIEQGFPGNTYYYTAWNHAGTHVDAPAHMLSGGRSITDFSLEDFVFERPVLVEVPKEDDQLITAGDLRPHEKTIADCDLLLLRTGFSRHRKDDPSRYRDQNPGLSSDVAFYLDSTRFAMLRAIGIDAISMAAANHISEGIQAHKIVFSRADGSSILLIEDMNLAFDLSQLRRVFVVPMFIEGLDSSPCTVVAEIEVAGISDEERA